MDGDVVAYLIDTIYSLMNIRTFIMMNGAFTMSALSSPSSFMKIYIAK